MTNELSDKTVAFVVANEGVEQIELTRPWDAVEQAGGHPVLAATEAGRAQGFDHLDRADGFEVDVTTDRLATDRFDAVVVPGGVANADQLRTDDDAVRFVRGMVELGKPAAVICHGPWVLVEADAVRGRTLTSWPSLRTDITNAGGQWVDEEVVVCTDGPNALVTSRKPADLDAFCATLVDVFAKAAGQPARATA